MDRLPRRHLLPGLLLALFATGCASPYRSDQGAVIGGLGGAGLGAIVGNAVGHTGAGAAIGAGVGALSGAAIGGSLDEIEAKNRAMIESRLQRPVGPNPVTIDEVIAMTQAGVSEEVIITHLRYHGVARPLQAADLIVLQQRGVSGNVIRAMQDPPVVAAQPVVVQPPPPQPVIIEQYPYYPYPPPHWHYRPYRCMPPPHVGVGVSFHN